MRLISRNGGFTIAYYQESHKAIYPRAQPISRQVRQMATCIQLGERRGAPSMYFLVETARRYRNTLGVQVARAFLTECSVPAHVVERVPGGDPLRRTRRQMPARHQNG